jgi:hypothetical protein
MPTLIPAPTIVQATGTKPERIVPRMVSPEGWEELGQRREFQEITLVLRGTLRGEHEGGVPATVHRDG